MERDLGEIRSGIDEDDDMIIAAATRRFKRTDAAGDMKEQMGKPIIDRTRHREVIEHYRTGFEAEGLPPELGEALAAHIHSLSVRRQMESRLAPKDP